MKFSKDFLSSDFLQVYKISASYHGPFRHLTGVTYRGQKFYFLGFLLTKNFKTLFSKRANSVYKFYISNESL